MTELDVDLYEDYLDSGMDEVMCFEDYKRLVEKSSREPMHKNTRLKAMKKECESNDLT
jgi:hypothetical protein